MPHPHHNLIPGLVVRLAFPKAQLVVLVATLFDALAFAGAVKCMHLAL
jgi:hypothetical protein